MVKESESKSTFGEKYVKWNRIIGYPLLAIGILASAGWAVVAGGVNVAQAEIVNKRIKKKKKKNTQ